MTPQLSSKQVGPFPHIPVSWKGFQMFSLRQYIKVPTRSEYVTNSGHDKSLLSPALECAVWSPSPSPLEWILDPSKPRTLLNRILGHLLLAEAKEPNPHYRDDYRIAWITCKWAFEGVHKPHVAATYRVLGVHPDLVWWHILQDRRARLDREFSDWFDAAGNLRLDVPKKPVTSSGQVSPMSENPSGSRIGTRLQECGIGPDSVLSPEEAAERSTSERLAALIQFQPKKETA